jgi:hypothetical protein
MNGMETPHRANIRHPVSKLCNRGAGEGASRTRQNRDWGRVCMKKEKNNSD